MFFATLRRLRTAINATSHIALTPNHSDRSAPKPAGLRSRSNCAANEPRITAIELKNRILKIRRREKLSGMAGKVLRVDLPVVGVAHSGQCSQKPSISTAHSAQRFIPDPLLPILLP